MILNPKQLDELTNRFVELLPDSVRNMQQDMEKNLRAMLRSTLSKLDLVTREEFDIQTAVLARTRAKLEVLEQQLAEIESKYSPK